MSGSRLLFIMNIKFHALCKICKLYDQAPRLFENVHTMVLEQKTTFADALRVINGRISILNKNSDKKKKIVPLNMVNMSNHFRKHVPVKEATAIAIRRHVVTPKPVYPEEYELLTSVQKKLDTAVVQKMDDYAAIKSIADSLMARFYQIDDEIGEAQLPWDKLEKYKNLAREAAMIRTKLVELRQSEALIEVVIMKLMDTFMEGTLTDVFDLLKGFRLQLVDGGFEGSQATELEVSLRKTIGDFLKKNARASLGAIRAEFKL